MASEGRLLRHRAGRQELEQLGDHASVVASEVGATIRQDERHSTTSCIPSIQAHSFRRGKTNFFSINQNNSQFFKYICSV